MQVHKLANCKDQLLLSRSMSGQKEGDRRSYCPVNVAVELLGDRWSLLVVRDLMFRGYRTYGELLDSSEGIATNMLADRLKKLVTAGVIETEDKDSAKPAYRLTAKGVDLAPVLVELILWSAHHEKTLAPPALVRRIEKNKAAFIAEIRRYWKQGGLPIISEDCFEEVARKR